MTDATPTLTMDDIAKLCYDNYYKTEVTSPNTVASYLENGDYERHDNTFENLVEALYDDIRDLLHNGNDEDLFGTALNGQQAEDIAQALHDGWNADPDPLEQVCESLARLMLLGPDADKTSAQLSDDE